MGAPMASDAPAEPRSSDLDTLARTIWGEARGEGPDGMAAVAWVALNRAGIAARYEAVSGRPHPLYGDGTVAGACTRPLQFSCWNASDRNRPLLLAATMADPAFAVAWRVAGDVLDGAIADPTAGATHYHEASVHPSWAQGQTPTQRIGRHVFYRLSP
jgi:spore germination cell wall hydrolase CwlJ-like protein